MEISLHDSKASEVWSTDKTVYTTKLVVMQGS